MTTNPETTFTQADIDAADKRGRAIGTANASRNFQASLPEAVRQQREIAWDEGYAGAIDDYGTDIPWGGSISEDNPYRTPDTTETT